MLKLLLECWRNGSTLAQTARNVELRLREIERLTTELQLEWGDVLDKLLAREDRQRKRDKKAVAESVAPPSDGEQLAVFPPTGRRLLGRK